MNKIPTDCHSGFPSTTSGCTELLDAYHTTYNIHISLLEDKRDWHLWHKNRKGHKKESKNKPQDKTVPDTEKNITENDTNIYEKM